MWQRDGSKSAPVNNLLVRSQPAQVIVACSFHALELLIPAQGRWAGRVSRGIFMITKTF